MEPKVSKLILWAGLLCFFLLAAVAASQPGEPRQEYRNPFMRIAVAGGKREFQMASVTYRMSEGSQTVTLMGAVHIASPGFYEVMQEKFKAYDAVIMEGIGAREKYGALEPASRLRGGPVAWLCSLEKGKKKVGRQTPASKEGIRKVHDVYGEVSAWMGFSEQMEQFDFQKDNFVFADMAEAELQERLGQKGIDYLMPEEKVFEMMLPLVRNLMGPSSESSARPTPLQNIVRNLMAEMMVRTDLNALVAGDSPELKERRDYFQVIVEERNRKVLESVRRLLGEGKKKIAVFYGALHLPSLEKDLVREFQAHRVGEEWITAWELN